MNLRLLPSGGEKNPRSSHRAVDAFLEQFTSPKVLSSPRIAEVMKAFLQGEPDGDEVIMPPLDLRLRTTIMLDDATLDRYVGRYRRAPNVLLTITKAEGTLSVDVPGQGTFTFYPETATIFFMKEADVQITFVAGDQGAVSETLVKNEGSETRVKRVE